MCLVILLSRNQPASLEMIQNKLFIEQRRILEPCYIRSLSKTPKNVHYYLQKLYLDTARSIVFENK